MDLAVVLERIFFYNDIDKDMDKCHDTDEYVDTGFRKDKHMMIEQEEQI